MREAEFSGDAWHCKLARFGGLPDYREETDICEYLRAIGKGIIGVAFVGALLLTLGGMTAWLLGDLIGWLAAIAACGAWIRPEGLTIAALVVLGVASAIGLFYGCAKLAKAGSRAVSDTFVGDAVDSMKNRMCFRVRIRDDAERS